MGTVNQLLQDAVLANDTGMVESPTPDDLSSPSRSQTQICSGKENGSKDVVGPLVGNFQEDDKESVAKERAGASSPTPSQLQSDKKHALLCLRLVAVLGGLYFFICSLTLLADAFRLLGGREAGSALGKSDLFNNPVAGVMMGVLATVLVQSSSTTTSITVALTAAGSR